ncbi:hypothetical protein DPSP01_009742 [Paraphaeosphaeria sporulosa]
MSISTEVPSGSIPPNDRCLGPLYDLDHWTDPNPPIFSCANAWNAENATRGLKDSDFQTFCCDGEILGSLNWTRENFELQDLECCRYGAELSTGPLPDSPDDGGDGGTFCAERYGFSRTPLASLAATGTAEAQPFPVTYNKMGASRLSSDAYMVWSGSTLSERVVTETPYCLWVDTVHGVQMTSVEVPKADVTTLPRTGSAEASARPSSGSSLGSGSEVQRTGSSTAEGVPSNGAESGTSTGGAGPEPTGASNAPSVPAVMCLGLMFVSWVLLM